MTFPTSKGWHTGRESWGFVHPLDSDLVNLTRYTGGHGNFYPSDYQFSIKRNVPDGVYKIYINDTISLRGAMKEGKKDGAWTEYFRDVLSKYREVTWSNGVKNGKGFSYFKNGKIAYQWEYVNGSQHGISLSFDINGILMSKTYYEHGMCIKTEVLDENGVVISVHFPPVVDD